MDNSNEVAFDKELRSTIERYSNDGLLSAGEIIAVLEVVKHSTLHAATGAATDTKVDNFTSANTCIAKLLWCIDKFEQHEAIAIDKWAHDVWVELNAVVAQLRNA